MRLEHGINSIWDMELFEYDNTLLDEMYEDTIIEIVSQIASEDLYPVLRIWKSAADKWMGAISVKTVDLPEDVVKKELDKIKERYVEYEDFLVGEEILISVRLSSNMGIHQAVDLVEVYAEMIQDDLHSLKQNRVSRMACGYITTLLPVYHRAMEKVKLELANYLTDDKENDKKIVDICGRVKTLDSIREKIKRKGIGQFEVFDKFNDIAGVRCICEYLDDVYDVLKYINENPMFKVLEIDDKIGKPTQEGYRGIHVIVSTQIYYQKKTYNEVKVEIQLRTAFQNAWSMKTHQLTYKKDSIESEKVKDVLRKLSDVLNEADETALKMKQISK